ncbi:MAG: hypothetical protein M3O07_08890, partial [Pseudomonadota bacterium]|nr:hypothetical protein [Pseudomonadota bacterium]
MKLLLKHRCCPCTSLAALIAAFFTWSGTAHAASFYPVRPADPRAVFAERGGTAGVTDASGNVYIAGSEVWIYDRKGKPLGIVEVPERPGSLAFGGEDRR